MNDLGDSIFEFLYEVTVKNIHRVKILLLVDFLKEDIPTKISVESLQLEFENYSNIHDIDVDNEGKWIKYWILRDSASF